LAAETGHAIAIAVWGNFGPTVVRLIEAKQPLHVSLRIGSVLSIFDTATGRAFASVLPKDRLRHAIAGPLGEAITNEQWKKRIPELLEIVSEAKKHGVSRAVGNPIPGVNAFSAPVFDLEGNPVLVITVTDHANRLSGDWSSKAVDLIVHAAKDLTSRLGGKHPNN
jgi:DNA-binding IclR family transcriptional regulator